MHICTCADEYTLSSTLFHGQDGYSPLYVACTWNQPDVVDILLQNGADPIFVSKV